MSCLGCVLRERHPGTHARRSHDRYTLVHLAIRLIMRDYALVLPGADAANGLRPLQEAIQRLEAQMGGFRDTLENMQNDVRDIKHNVRDLMPDVRTSRNNFGAIHKEVNKMRCSDAQLMAINLNKVHWSIGQRQLEDVPSDGRRHRRVIRDVQNLQPLRTLQDILDLDGADLDRWLHFYNIFDDAQGRAEMEKKHLLFNFLGGSEFGLHFQPIL